MMRIVAGIMNANEISTDQSSMPMWAFGRRHRARKRPPTHSVLSISIAMASRIVITPELCSFTGQTLYDHVSASKRQSVGHKHMESLSLEHTQGLPDCAIGQQALLGAQSICLVGTQTSRIAKSTF